MLKPKKSSIINDESGMAIFELIPIIIVIVLLVNFSLGFFGAIHTGILNSIAARNYAMGTFNHRANLTYLRNNVSSQVRYHYDQHGLRIHGVTTDKMGDENWTATTRKIDFFDYKERAEVVGNGSKAIHNKEVNTITESERNQKVGANPIWIKTAYGICLNASCGS